MPSSDAPTALAREFLAHPERRYVMFGGGPSGFGAVSSTPTASLFEYDGVAWSQSTAPGPSPRSKHSLVFDIATGEALLFGGSTGTSNLGDTWLWNGTWSQAPAGTR